MARETTVRRTDWYLGPDEELTPDDLQRYDREGKWLIEPKIDGMWAMMVVGDPAMGIPNVLSSRDARTGPITGSRAGALISLQTGLPQGTVLAGELEAASQWATETVERRGYRKFHVFDMPRFGDEDLRDLPLEERKHRLMTAMAGAVLGGEGGEPRQLAYLPPVEVATTDFRANYERWVDQGFEGIVLKKKGSLYRTRRMDGKTNEWLRCKKWVTEDYVLAGLAFTEGGVHGTPRLTGRWGLFTPRGELRDVMQAHAPDELLDEALVGKIVCEFRGWARFKSGALRHAQFVRLRTDKRPEECKL